MRHYAHNDTTPVIPPEHVEYRPIMLSTFFRTRSSRGRRFCLHLALAGFLVRALIPIGFMPAALAAGGPITVCHGGLAGAFFQQLAEQAHTGHDHSDTVDHLPMGQPADLDSSPGANGQTPGHEAWDNCPTGATASGAALAPEFSLSLLALSHRQPGTEADLGIPAIPISFYQARAPPLHLAQRLS